MTRDEAVAAAEEAHARLGVPESSPVLEVAPAWMELAEPGESVTLVRDALVWRVWFELPPGPSLAFEQATGALVAVEWYQ